MRTLQLDRGMEELGMEVLHSVEQSHKVIRMLKFIHYLSNSEAESSILATEKPQTKFDSLDSILQACKKAQTVRRFTNNLVQVIE